VWKKLFLLATILCITVSETCQCIEMENKKVDKTPITPIELDDEEWRKRLTPEQYHVLREKETERPFTGKFYLHKEKGVYVCAGCGLELFYDTMKFDSPCGWPSFEGEIPFGRILKKPDFSYNMVRTEILCARCGGHLGHLFEDGPTQSGLRYCVNSLSLDFIPQK